MLRYPSTKQILTVAVLSALLAGCGKETKKATADSNIMDEAPMAVRPEASIAPVALGTELELTNTSDEARQKQAVALAAVVLTTTLNLDSGSTAVKQAISAFAGSAPQDSASGALQSVIGEQVNKCSKGGEFALALLMGEGADVHQSGAFNHEEVYFSSDFRDCNLGAAKIDGGLGMSLTLGIAELINSSQFRIETAITASNLHVVQGAKDYYADGAAGYKFYTNNGYELNNELYADSFNLNAGLGMSLIDLSLKQVNNTATNSWTMTIGAKYQAGDTYVDVSTGASAPLVGKGYGYPSGGELHIYTKKPDPSIPNANSVVITIKPTALLAKHPLGTLVWIDIYKANGSIDTALGYSWADIEGAVKDYIKTRKLTLPAGTPDEGVEN